MTNPQRLSESSASDVERLLLRSAESDGLQPAGRKRLALALGVGVTVTSVTGAAAGGVVSGAAALGTRMTVLAAMKWLAILVVPLSAGGGAVYLARRAPIAPSAAPSAQVVISNDRPAAPRTEPADTVLSTATATATSSSSASTTALESHAPIGAVAASTKAKPSSLADEVKALEAARRALAGKNSGAAIDALNQYERDFPKRTLGPEANMLRIEALLQQGNRTAATTLAKRLLSKSRGVYEARIRTLMPELVVP